MARTPTIAALILALAVGLCAAPPALAELKLVSQGPPLQVRTQRFVVRSDKIGHDFLIEVTTPPVTAPPGVKLPAVYALDGGYGVVGQAATLLVAGRQMSPAYIVSVGYTDPRGPNFGPGETDLLHRKGPRTPGGPEVGGGGALFETVLVEEIKPFLEARLPLDPARAVLFGHGLSGTFTATVLANRPQAFAAYLIGSPALNLDPGLVDKVKAAAPRGGGRRVFIGFTPEDVGPLNSNLLGPVLAAEGSTFRVRQQPFEGETHVSSYLQLVARGLPFVMPPPAPTASAAPRAAVTVDPQVLARHAGAYRFGPGAVVTITVEGGKLFGQMTGQPRLELVAESETRFAVPAAEAQVTFNRDAEGKTVSLAFRQDGREQVAPREP